MASYQYLVRRYGARQLKRYLNALNTRTGDSTTHINARPSNFFGRAQPSHFSHIDGQARPWAAQGHLSNCL